MAYIPLYSPCRPVTSNSSIFDSSASCDNSRFVTIERSLSEDNLSIGYVNSASKHCLLPTRKTSICSVHLDTPVAPGKLPTKRIKSCGEVLTSAEFLERLEEAEKAKEEKAKQKEEKKLQRSQRAIRKKESKGML